MKEKTGLKIPKKKIREHIKRFPDAKILVIGDIILDEYIWGDVSRISPEAPVPVVDIKDETRRLGGAANVINNIASLGGQCILCGLIGDDNNGKTIQSLLANMDLSTEGIVIDPDRRTSIKTRIVAHNQQVVRFDREDRKPVDSVFIKKLTEYIKNQINNLDAIIVEDYGKGMISVPLMLELRKIAADSNTIIVVDPKLDNFESYVGIDIITPNHHEAAAFCRFEITDEQSLFRAGNLMLEELNCHAVLITQGKDGMTLFERGEAPFHIPTNARKVFDVSGAGDTVISALCLALASGMDLKTSAITSNFAAGIVVGEIGTSVVTTEELIEIINDH